MKSVCILAIGDELLNGSTIDSNSQWMKEQLRNFNANVIKSIIIPDTKSLIISTIRSIIDESFDFLIITGGLGPTHDDITKESISILLGKDMYIVNEHAKYLKSKYLQTNIDKKIDDMIRSQSMVVNSFKPIENNLGTALGMDGKIEDTKLFVLPGVPIEMRKIFKDYIMQNYFSESSLATFTFRTTGISESKLYLLLDDIINDNDKLKFAFLPHFYGVNLRMSELKTKSSIGQIEKIKNRIKPYFYGMNNMKLEKAVSELLIAKNNSISIAESCTGGLLLKKLTDIPGSSNFMLGGIVAYSDNIKSQILGIPKDLLLQKGAVSPEVALSMSFNIAKKFDSDIGISITGISGPNGGTKSKPVGLYYISLKTKDKHFVEEFNFQINNREVHRDVVSVTALNLLRLNVEDI